MIKLKKTLAAGLAALLCLGTLFTKPEISVKTTDLTAYAASETTLSDLPGDYQYAADWIWNNRILAEKSVEAWNIIYDQIVAGDGTLNYIVRWQSYKTITLQQRQNIQQVLEKSINEWTNWLVGYDDWPFEHVNVKIVGWAVIDENCLLDRQPYETVYTDTIPYDNSYDISAGMGDSSIPNVVPALPNEIFRYEHWADKSYEYPGGYENRFDMHLHATQGLIDIGGYGYYWGQQLSDNAILGLCDGTVSAHVLQHEMGHGFGLTDFYGGEGESDGFPPGGFPGGGTSIMMAGSSSVITDFDGWFFRYVWSKIKEESGRFDLSEPTQPPVENTSYAGFTDTISDIGSGYVTFSQNGTYYFSGDYYDSDEQKNLSNYETGDKITVNFSYYTDTNKIVHIDSLTLESNIRDDIVKGDVNADKQFNVTDLVMLQKWLLGTGDLTDWKAGDLYEDDVINVFDLCLMKRELIE